MKTKLISFFTLERLEKLKWYFIAVDAVMIVITYFVIKNR